MLKKMSIRKIMVSSLALFVLLLLYLIPDNTSRELEVKTDDIEYVYSDLVSPIYLLDSNDYIARTTISTCDCNIVEKATNLIDGLIIDGKKNEIIPNGFKAIIPAGTSVNDISLEDKVLTIDFSKELLDINERYEEKMIESLIFSLTSIDGIDKVIINVDGKRLERLPISGKILPTLFDKSYGINKIYDITSMKNIDSYTVYYVSKNNDNIYYVPITKYVNKQKDDKIKVIVDELASAPIYETNLISYLNGNTKLINYEIIEDDIIRLNFNNYILDDIKGNKILEEVIYTISLSIKDNYTDIREVDFLVEDEEIYKKVEKNFNK